jgi:photosystem II stability/assembly factor-like uncharacterized protein
MLNSTKSRLAAKTFLQTLFFFLLVTQICFAQWYQQNSGTTQNLNKVQFVEANNGWAVGDSGIILHTTNAGSTWMQQTSSTNYSINAVIFIDNDIGWVVGDDGIILKTTNRGANWANQSSGTTSSLRSIHFVDSNNGLVVGYNGTIIKTTNGGNSWSIESSGADYEQLRSIFFYDNNNGWIAGGYQYGFPTYVVETKLWKTTDAGGNWIQKINNGNTILSGVRFFDNNLGIAIGGDYRAGSKMVKLSKNLDGLESLEFNDGPGNILITNDGGENWTVIFEETDPPFNYAFNDAYFVTQNTIVVAGSTISELIQKQLIFISTNRGIDWVSYTKNNGDDWADLNGICFVDSLNGWVVGGGGTILHTTNGGVSFVEEEKIDGIPTEYNLTQNFPNPFNPITKIIYTVSQSSNVVIKVFDVLGNEIETLVNEEKPVGTYELKWDAANLPSGVYFYQLTAGQYVETKKMVLIR